MTLPLFLVLAGACGPAQETPAPTGPPTAPAGVELLATATLAADARDRSGLAEPIPGSDLPQDRLGSLGSALAHTGTGELYVALNDRGPKDGALGFLPRFQTLAIAFDAGSRTLRVELRATTLFTDPDGARYSGLATALAGERRLDPEGVRVSRSGTLFTSDEYGPCVDEWTAEGVHVRRLAVPARFRAAAPSGEPKEELPPRNRSGRQPNRGMEGLARSPDGKKLYGALQSPLLQDGALDARNERAGIHVRVLELDVATGATRELVLALEAPSNGINELVAAGEHTLLALERDGKKGKNAEFKRVYALDLRGASDVSAVEALPARGLPDGVRPIAKTLLIDFLDPRFALAGKGFPEKLEGLEFGPDLPDGRRLLLVSVDNDFDPDVPNAFWAFALAPELVPDFRRPAYDVAWKVE